MKNEARELFALFYSLLPSGAEMTHERERVAKAMIRNSETVDSFRELLEHRNELAYTKVLAERILEQVDRQIELTKVPDRDSIPSETITYQEAIGATDEELARELGKRKRKPVVKAKAPQKVPHKRHHRRAS